MREIGSVRVGFLVLVILVCCGLARAEDLKPIHLPKPRMEGGKPLMQALKDRKTARSFSAKTLPPQVLSDLLWAAVGVNRADTGKRTAPSAVNWQEISLYVALPEGLYVYDAPAQALKPVLGEDIRRETGRQGFTAQVALDLVYVADRARMGKGSDADKDFYSAVDTGFISQNVYLFCASEGLSTVVLGSVDKTALAGRMKLRPEQRVMLTQPVGYPGE